MWKAGIGVGLVALGVGAYFYLSPYVALDGLKTAIDEKDAAALEERVDFPELRDNLKGQLNAAMLEKSGAELESNPLGALAIGLASKFVDGMVDAFVTPAGLANLSKGNRPQPAAPRPGSKDSPDAHDSSEDLFADARLTRDSLSRFSLWVPVEKGGETQFVFRRHGLSWKLTSIFLPLDE